MIDLVNIRIISGHGGNGASGFHREKFVSRGGPDGGDGGRGGDVIFEADNGLTTLAHFRHARMYKAMPGVNGAANKMHGANGSELVLKVPPGTMIKSEESDQVWDIDTPGLRVVVAKGGDGGRGNARFANSVRQAPHFAEKGMPGELLSLQLELKLLADVGLIGLPNAGKSTLIRAVSRATPDVADFPFTTLEPVLGVVDLGVEAFVMADLPGLIEGAHEGVGLGIQFLRHVERTRVLVHVLDAGSEDPVADYETVRRELEMYGGGLAEKPEIVALNKIDLSDTRVAAEKLEGHLGHETLLVSGASGEGTRTLMTRLQQLLHETAPPPIAITETRPILRPKERDRLEVVQDGDIYLVRGERAEEAALKLGEQGEEALDELHDRMRKMGLDKAMRRVGARPGDVIRVGGIELEWFG